MEFFLLSDFTTNVFVTFCPSQIWEENQYSTKRYTNSGLKTRFDPPKNSWSKRHDADASFIKF